jgi:peptidoglycan hydrolase-like protein with peptidoglycan-binding domain
MATYREVTGDHPELEEYTKGEWVLYAQQLLQKAGYEPQDHKIDGLFGPMTKEAVRDFQGAHGLKVDGIIGPKTWAALEGGGATGQLEFDQTPYVDSYGWLTWTVKNTGSATAAAGIPAGDYEMTDSNQTVIPGYTIDLAADLQPGQTSGAISANLVASTPADGAYQVSVKLGDHYEFVDYKVVNGVAQP